MAKKSKHTSSEAAGAASKVLRDGRTSDDSKTAAGSALSQANKKVNKTSGSVAAEKASTILQDENTGKNSKTAAGSVLAQKNKGKK